jgi:hypothetical protein
MKGSWGGWQGQKSVLKSPPYPLRTHLDAPGRTIEWSLTVLIMITMRTLSAQSQGIFPMNNALNPAAPTTQKRTV